MKWAEIREAYPERWLLLEILDSHTIAGRQHIERVAPVEECPDGRTAMKRCSAVQRAHPDRDYVFAHTSRRELEVYERSCVGVRWGRWSDAAPHARRRAMRRASPNGVAATPMSTKPAAR
jgi:hypothetical protein